MDRRLAVVILAIAGCKYAESPDKIAALEKRVNKLAAEIDELHDAPAPAGKHDGDHAPAAHPEPAAHTPVAHASRHWSYVSDTGPAHWAELDPAFDQCAHGEQQSPIDVARRAADPDAPEVFFIYQPTAGEVVDNGHTLQVNLARGSYAIVDGRRYDLLQFHVHTPSEHTLAGATMPMELHLVHQDKGGKLAVVGVMFAAGARSPALAPMWKAAPRKAGAAKLKKRFDPAALLPRDRSAYRYDGSLTTPPCSEGVEWIVLRGTATEDGDRITAFRDRFGANARPVQALGGRTVE